MSIFSSTPQDHEGYTVHKFQLAGKWSESEKISCHAILKNLYEPKMDVILTISFKVTAEIEIRKHMFCIVLRRRGVSVAYSFIHSLPRNAFCFCCCCFLTVSSAVLRGSVIFNGVCRWIFRGKGIKRRRNQP